MKKILVSRALTDAVMQRAHASYDITLRKSDSPMSAAEMRSSLVLYDGMIPTLGDMFSADIFAEFGRTKCKILANFGVGINHIDVAAARDHGITVTNTPGAVTDATADIGLTLLLMSARRAGEGERLARSGNWAGWTPTQMLGSHVSGKTVGIVGMGRIGQAIARRCHFGFGMSVKFFNRSPKEIDFPATQIANLETLAAEVDFLVVATPGGAETTHLINASIFDAMKPTAHFINIARGEIVDETALIAALEAQAIAGAGLDVYEHEPAVPNALRKLDTVTLLPHLGTATEEVRDNMGHMSLDNLDAFFAGETPPNAL
ncbi:MULTISPECIES: 2-hydroxyacid dehydrogenase [Lentibacter]|jgi:lactate dehydrogenase-like 2-hydroxyacid dehydrogenase|uniref:Hydroxypyruvate reductase n=2 Tax=Lentibacter algarum TaxID=576131 RepID=A0A1H3LNW4_9RHOB|nr:D-glycerate dehydrogenase [Lentibacter algarum]MCO4777276.1 D-glycerate dehydrogenase [Lentibacter algarum]MCO4828049.1 D-glycerate dehydrogenase [Lentibacter algarum]WIF32648.1 glyoxylate reductase GyaR [Lentibacter algarum]SDY66237.1 hydroxypyruvate reductase [Lentibacter algarum]